MGRLSIKQKRLYRRIYFTEKVKFGYDKPIYSGMSINLSPDGMNIISDKALVPLSNLIIDIYVKKIKADNTEKLEIIRVEGEVVWGGNIFQMLLQKWGLDLRNLTKN